MLGLAVGLSAGAQVLGGIAGGRSARKAARRNARNIRAEANEAIRRTRMQNKNVLGSAVANTGSAGVRYSGSPLQAILELETEQQTQIEWMEKARDMGIRQAISAGNDASRASIIGGAVGGLGTLSAGYQAGAFTSQAKVDYQAQQPNYFAGGGNQ